MKRLIILLFLISCYNTFAQAITFYPKVVYVDPIKRTGEFVVSNNSFSNVEVEMKYRFGYPDYDSVTGSLKMNYDDSSLAAWSLDPYLKIFPRKFILGGQKRQMVRFIITHPHSIPDGTYFTRIIASAQKSAKNVDTSTFKKKDTISMQYNVTTNLQTAIFYEKGQIESNISLGNTRQIMADSAFYFVLGIDKTGNTPFWGNYSLEIYDKGSNSLVESDNGPLPIYLKGEKKFKLTKDKFKPGNYLAKIKIDNKRDEIPVQLLPKFDEIYKTYEFSIP